MWSPVCDTFTPSKEWNAMFDSVCDLKEDINFYRSGSEAGRTEITKSVGKFLEAYAAWMHSLEKNNE